MSAAQGVDRDAPAPVVSAARIGVLLTGGTAHPTYAALRAGLAALGRVEGVDIAIEPRFAEGRLDRLPRLAAELAAIPVDVIAAIGAVHCQAALRAAPGIPVVFAVVLDPMEVGLVASAHRPGGTATGVTNFDPDGAREEIHLLRRVIPGLQRLAILGDAGVPDALPRAALAASEAEGLNARLLLLRRPQELDDAFAAMRAARAEALVALGVPIVGTHGGRIAALARAARLPAIFARDGAAFGPLLAYGTSFAAAARQMAGLVDRVLKGERPAEIPVERVSRLELVVNLSVARQIGVTIPSDVLERAVCVSG
jgi:putative tryptophan/tyrosine transport system substrate-binding protein